jgi:DNA-binding helix-hairpin-helix protein with protein kinase domain
MIVYGDNGERLELEGLIGSGGEARIFAVRNRPAIAVKLYIDPSTDKHDKLVGMTSMSQPVFRSRSPVTCWPSMLVYSDVNCSKFAGFAMERLTHHRPLYELLTRKSRLAVAPNWSYRYSIVTAANLSAAVSAIHDAGCVIGDLNSSNVLSHSTATVRILDCDSFQLRHSRTGKLHYCEVARPEYCAPELIGVPLKTTHRDRQHDYFALAVLVFQLLTDRHPFDATTIDDRAGSIEEKIKRGMFPSVGRSDCSPPPNMQQTYGGIPPYIRTLFEKTFAGGQANANNRTPASQLFSALSQAVNEIALCPNGHEYWSTASNCRVCLAPMKKAQAAKPALPPVQVATPAIRVLAYGDGDTLVYDNEVQNDRGEPQFFFSISQSRWRKFYGKQVWASCKDVRDRAVIQSAIGQYQRWIASQ